MNFAQNSVLMERKIFPEDIEEEFLVMEDNNQS
jgi:hypothetical protein